jgi:hypothetical protein
MAIKGKYGSEGLDAVSLKILDNLNSKMGLGERMFIINEAVRGQLAGYRKEVLHIIEARGDAEFKESEKLKFREIALEIQNIHIDEGFKNEF